MVRLRRDAALPESAHGSSSPAAGTSRSCSGPAERRTGRTCARLSVSRGHVGTPMSERATSDAFRRQHVRRSANNASHKVKMKPCSGQSAGNSDTSMCSDEKHGRKMQQATQNPDTGRPGMYWNEPKGKYSKTQLTRLELAATQRNNVL